MTPIMRKIMEAYAAPTPLRKAHAIEAALDALEAAVGTSKNALLVKAGGASITMRGEMLSLQAKIANIENSDRLSAGRQRAPQTFLARKPHR